MTDKDFERRAFDIMKEHALRHLVMTPLFMYRAAAYVFIALMAVFVYSLRARRNDLIILTAPEAEIPAKYSKL